MTGPTDFCRNLAWAMARRGWTTADLADRVGPEWNTKHSSACRRIRRYLSGAQSPKLDTVELFAEALRVFPKDLAFGDLEELHWGRE